MTPDTTALIQSLTSSLERMTESARAYETFSGGITDFQTRKDIDEAGRLVKEAREFLAAAADTPPPARTPEAMIAWLDKELANCVRSDMTPFMLTAIRGYIQQATNLAEALAQIRNTAFYHMVGFADERGDRKILGEVKEIAIKALAQQAMIEAAQPPQAEG